MATGHRVSRVRDLIGRGRKARRAALVLVSALELAAAAFIIILEVRDRAAGRQLLSAEELRRAVGVSPRPERDRDRTRAVTSSEAKRS